MFLAIGTTTPCFQMDVTQPYNLHSSRKLRTACCHYEMSTHTALYGILSQPGALSNVQCCRADLSSAKVKGTVLLSSMEGSRGCCAPRGARIRSTRLLTRRKCRTSKASKCKDAASRKCSRHWRMHSNCCEGCVILSGDNRGAMRQALLRKRRRTMRAAARGQADCVCSTRWSQDDQYWILTA